MDGQENSTLVVSQLTYVWGNKLTVCHVSDRPLPSRRVTLYINLSPRGGVNLSRFAVWLDLVAVDIDVRYPVSSFHDVKLKSAANMER